MKRIFIRLLLVVAYFILSVTLLAIQPYIDYVFYDEEEITVTNDTYLVNLNNNYDTFILKTKENLFYEKIEELLTLKYPEFIVEILMQSKNIWTYKLKEEYIEITFNIASKNDIINNLMLVVYYNEIKDYINVSYTPNLLYENENGFNYSNTEKTIAFTFDDGPHLNYTNQLIDILYKNKAKGTFFLLGLNMSKYPDIVKSLASSNNEVGTHTYNHKNFYKLSKNNILKEIESSRTLYNEITNKEINLLRPPYGNINNKIKKHINYPIILWNVDPEDWQTRNTNYIVNHVIDNVEDGDIILFHDVYKSTVDAIEILLPKLYLMGYQVVDVTTLSQIKNSPLIKGEVYYSFK